MIEDILRYLENKEEEEFKTNQGLVGMQQLFCRYVVKVWKGSNFNQEKYHSLNKIIVRHCVQYYIKCWKYQNKIYHDSEEQRKRAVKWKRNLERHVERNEPMQVKIFARKSDINLETCETETIYNQIRNVKKIMNKVSNLPKNNIR